MTMLNRHASCLIWLSLALLLGACAQRAPLPTQTPRLDLPLQLQIERRSQGEVRTWLLVIQQEGDALRWSLFDPLGVPLARQLLVDGRWRADGLLPPNAEARELFAALLFALTPADQLDDLYSDTSWSPQQDGRSLARDTPSAWHVRYRENDRFDLDVGSALTYGVAPIATATGARQK